MWYKVKKIYVWDKQVRPAPLYEYSYDFKNKTTTILANDGWTNISWATINSSWITFSSWNDIRNEASWLWTAMSSAKKVTMKWSFIRNSTSNTLWFTLLKLNTTSQTGAYADNNWYAITCWWSTVQRITSAIPASTYTFTLTYDFVNKEVKVNFPWINTNTYTLTDTQIANAKICNLLRCPIQSDILQSIYLLIE